MMEVGLGAHLQVPMPRRSDEELLIALMTREFIRSLTTEELIVVHDQGLCGIGRKEWASMPAQEAIETIRQYDQRPRMRPPNGCMVKARRRVNTLMIS
jgi:hypothetical protein